MAEEQFAEHIRNCIVNGVKQCVLLLGPPGVGKSHTAETVIKKISKETDRGVLIIRHDMSLFHSDMASLHAICTQAHLLLNPPKDLPRRTSRTSSTDFLNHLKYCINFANASGKMVVLLSDHFERFCCGEDPSATLAESRLTKRARQSLIYQLVDMVHQPGVFFVLVGMSSTLNVQQLFEKRVQSRFLFQQVFKMTPANNVVDLVDRLLPPGFESDPRTTGEPLPGWSKVVLRKFARQAILKDVGVRDAWQRALHLGKPFGYFLQHLRSCISTFLLRLQLFAFEVDFTPPHDGWLEIDAQDQSGEPSGKRRKTVTAEVRREAEAIEKEILELFAPLESLLPLLLGDFTGQENQKILTECAFGARLHRERNCAVPFAASRAFMPSEVDRAFPNLEGDDLKIKKKLFALKDTLSRAGLVLLATVARKHKHLSAKGALSSLLQPSAASTKAQQTKGRPNELTLDVLVGETEAVLERWREVVPSRLQLWSDVVRLAELGVIQLRVSSASDNFLTRPLANHELRLLPSATSSAWTAAVVAFPLWKEFVTIAGLLDTNVARWTKVDLSL